MEFEEMHELTAAYALHALDPGEERAFEEHLRRCERCREELVTLESAASMLAYGVQAQAPPARLRERILEQARAERPDAAVIPLRRRALVPALASIAAAAVGVVIGLGVWGASVSSTLDEERAAGAARAEVLALAADAQARRLSLSGAEGALIVGRSGEAALLVSNLGLAPEDKTYEVWVIGGGRPVPAGLFHGGAESAVLLTRPVAQGDTVAVTVEPAQGSDQPTTQPLFSATV